MACCEDMLMDWEQIKTDAMNEPIREGDCRNCGKTVRETWTERVHEVV